MAVRPEPEVSYLSYNFSFSLVKDKFKEFVQQLGTKFGAAGARFEIGERSETLNKRIKTAALLKVPLPLRW